MFSLILFASFATLSFFISDIIYKYVSDYFEYYKIAAIVTGIGAIPMFLLLLVNLNFSNLFAGFKIDVFIIISSIFLVAGYILNFMTLKTEQATNTFSLSVLQPAMLIMFGFFVMKEHITFIEIIALILLVIGTFLVTSNERLKLNKQFIPAIVANISWASYWFIMALMLTIKGINYISFISFSRMFAFVVGIVFLFWLNAKRHRNIAKKYNDKQKNINKKLVLIIFIAAFSDGIGNLLFLFITKSKNLIFGSIFLAMLPALIGIFAYLFFKDRLNKMQLIGLAMIISIGVLLSL